MTSLPEINWHQLRGKAPSGSQRDGFEELVSQLMISGDLLSWPTGTRFSTFGNPDGGREGRGELPDGTVWAWQAKYLFRLETAELQQIAKSIKRVLQNEPKLTRYFVLLPYNPPAGDTAEASSAWTKWSEYVKRWEAKAQAAGLDVEFTYLGETQLNSCLLQPAQVGRLRYWFDLEAFSEYRYRAIAERAAADAGGRYTPELSVRLPIAGVFDGLARTPDFQQKIRVALAAVRTGRGTYGFSTPEERSELFGSAISALGGHLDELETLMLNAIEQAGRPDGVLPEFTARVETARAALEAVAGLLRKHSLRDGRYYHGNAASLYHQINESRTAVAGVKELTASRGWRSFGEAAVLVTGTGGAGKTHLLCDLATARTANDHPTIIVLGEHFERGPIETDLGRIIGFTNPADQLLATFDVACQTAGEIGLVIIDGLNEPHDRSLWNRYLNSFLNEAAKFRYIRLVLSCRTEFLPDTLSETLLERLPDFQHTGFGEVPQDAISQFLDWYGIERPSFPMLDPEFTNPLFLKLLCTTMQTHNERRFPRNGIGTTWVYKNFLEAINDRLAALERCDYSRNNALVRQAVEQIATAMHAHRRQLPWNEVEALTGALLPGRTWSQSLLNGLLKEAVLSDLPTERGNYIKFGYERLGEIALAQLIAAGTPAALAERLGPMAEQWYRHAGVLQALASVLPEIHDVELIDVLSIPVNEYHHSAHTDLLLSIAWRNPDAITDRTVQLLTDLLASPDFTDQAHNTLLQVATIPGHNLNAEWLHVQLANRSLAQRDATWSYFCDRQDEAGGHLSALTDWAWSDASSTATDDTRQLTALTLAWALSATHRPIRDNATKAIIALLEPAAHLYPSILQRFVDCDDDAIEERLLAVGCGIAQRAQDPVVAWTIAEAIRAHTVDCGYWPQNYLSRDYARRAIEAALDHGWHPGSGDLATQVRPPYRSDWIEPQRSTIQIEELGGPPDYRYSTVSHPLMSDFDDFRKHLVEGLPRRFHLDGEIDADYLGRVMFDQVVHLGWTPETFGDIDRRRRYRTGDDKEPEGFAQKYIWTAYKQLVGRMTDRFPIDPRYRDEQRTTYETPLDIRGHDIDPTVLLRRDENRVYADTPTTWFAPAAATFPHGLDDTWATHDQHSPPVDHLITCTDAAGERWLVLEGDYKWSQPQYPEEAAADAPRHVTWAQIRSYLINAEDVDTWTTWAIDQNWYGRWMPDSGSPTGLLLADHPYKGGWPTLDADDHDDHRLPGQFLLTTAWYGGLANDHDQSHSKHLRTYAPSTAFCTSLGLQCVDEFRWGRDREIMAESFAARETGPDSVHVRADVARAGLAKEGKVLFWTILAEKETTLPDHRFPRDGRPLLRSYSASYLLDETKIRLVGASARTLHAGGEVSNTSDWNLPLSIPL
ncbi:hypothetical protein [Actinoplanes sp. NPDC026623]|uniref:NACHT domain-containing protein n=1 Tax=Actinoplanes sp. NPDC026623 TaxID=3155610 RepID=UPI0033E88E6E